MEKTEFIRCPVCGNKTRDKIREDTVLKNFPLFCPKCKSECLIDIEQFHITAVHFLNQVDDADLQALLEDGKAAPETCTCTTKCAAGAVNTNCPVCKTNMTECTGPEPEPQEPEETEQPQEGEAKGSGTGGLVVFLVVALIGGGAALLSTMERAGAEDMPEDAERQGLGTPATRASILEKLVQMGFVERKGKQLLPTKDGHNLVCVLPDVLTSPRLTAEWETKLTAIAKGEADPEGFMAGIEEMTDCF